MFGIGEGELAIIVVFGFLLFGPDKLPQMGRTIGRAIRQFRETQEKMTAVVQSEIIDPVSEAASAPVKPKKAAATDDDSEADEDAAETARVFDLLLGDNLAGRKDYIAENGCRYLDMIDVS